MEGPRSRTFALGFAGVIILGAVALIFFGEKSLRSRESWSLHAVAEQNGDSWSLEALPSRSIYLYAVSEDREGGLHLLFPLEADRNAVPLPPDEPFVRTLPAESGATLLVLADPRPLWPLEKARSRFTGGGPEGPIRLTPADILSIRGMGPLPEGSGEVRVSQIFAPGASEPDHARGLWARRFPGS
jgi:hypothetical protein